MNLNDLFNEEKVRLDPKCWTGKKIGNPKTKMKGGTRVNNCVPAESVDQSVAEGEGMLGRSKYDKRYLDKFNPTEVMNISDDPEMKAHRTTRQGSLRTSKKDLEFAFGPPGEDDTWVLEFRNGLVATIYPQPNSNFGMDWFIGGNHPDIEDYVLKAYSAAINDLEEGVAEEQLDEKWSKKYKDSINCSNPKGFSQKAHCAGKKKNESMTIEEKMELFLEKNCPTDPAKWSASKSAAKAKFDVYPSAYANGWAAKNYKGKGGGWKTCK